MDTEALYEKWRIDRSRSEPQEGFAERVMQRVDATAMPTGLVVVEPVLAGPCPVIPEISESNRFQQTVRACVCVAAALAAVFRVIEFLSLFAATGIET